MSFEAIGFLTSGVVLCVLLVLFRYEARAGVRVAERMRTHGDFLVLKVSHKISGVMRFIGRDLVRQIFHYIFHTFLKLILFVVKQEVNLRKLHSIKLKLRSLKIKNVSTKKKSLMGCK